MNKIKIALGAIVVGLVMVSCGADAKIDKLEKACKDKDYEQMEEIANELEKQMNDLTTEQIERVGNIMLNCATNKVNAALDAASSLLDE